MFSVNVAVVDVGVDGRDDWGGGSDDKDDVRMVGRVVEGGLILSLVCSAMVIVVLHQKFSLSLLVTVGSKLKNSKSIGASTEA